jgi:hypothetical protein
MKGETVLLVVDDDPVNLDQMLVLQENTRLPVM